VEEIGQETRNEEVSSTEGSQEGDGSMKPRPKRNANGDGSQDTPSGAASLGGAGEEAGSSGMSGVGTGTDAEMVMTEEQ
jgi:hypothetical protein